MDYGDVGVIVKLSKWKWSNTIGNRRKAVTKTVNSRHVRLPKTIAKKEFRHHYLAYWNQSFGEWNISRYFEWNIILKNLHQKNCAHNAVIISNIIYRSNNGKASLTLKNVNDHLDALNIDVVDNRNIYRNCLTNSRLHLSNTGYGKLAINFIKKMKALSKN